MPKHAVSIKKKAYPNYLVKVSASSVKRGHVLFSAVFNQRGAVLVGTAEVNRLRNTHSHQENNVHDMRY